MQNTGNFKQFYIARFETSSKYVNYVKMPSYKNIVKQTIKVCKCFKYKNSETEIPYISKIYKKINIFKEKSNSVEDFITFLDLSIKLNRLVSK